MNDFIELYRHIHISKRNRKFIVMLVMISAILLVMLFFGRQLVSIIFSTMLFILGCMSGIFRKVTGELNIGIEFVTFATILFLYSHGFAIALVACAIMTLVMALTSGYFSLTTLTGYGMYFIVCLIGLFLPFSIAVNGIILVIIMNIVGYIILLFMGMGEIKNIIYLVGNLLFNIILFKFFSAIVMQVL